MARTGPANRRRSGSATRCSAAPARRMNAGCRSTPGPAPCRRCAPPARSLVQQCGSRRQPCRAWPASARPGGRAAPAAVRSSASRGPRQTDVGIAGSSPEVPAPMRPAAAGRATVRSAPRRSRRNGRRQPGGRNRYRRAPVARRSAGRSARPPAGDPGCAFAALRDRTRPAPAAGPRHHFGAGTAHGMGPQAWQQRRRQQGPRGPRPSPDHGRPTPAAQRRPAAGGGAVACCSAVRDVEKDDQETSR